MADQVKRVEYYMGTMANKTGEAMKSLSVFKEGGVNLIGFLGYPKGARKAEVIFVVEEKTPKVGALGKKAGLDLGAKQKGFFVNGDDRPGAVADTLSKLADAGINVVSCHAMCAGEGRYGALVTVAADDLRKAGKVLGV